MWQGKENGHTRSPLTLTECILSPHTIAYTGCPLEYSAEERYNNNSEPLAVLAVPPFRTDVIFPSEVLIQNRELQFCFTWPIRFAQSVNNETVSLKVY